MTDAVQNDNLGVLAAVDCGAESGRVMAATLHEDAAGQKRIELAEVARFTNPQQIVDGLMSWDLPRLAAEIQKQPNGLLHQSNVSQNLLRVDRAQAINRFDLYNQAIIDEQIDAERSGEMKSLKLYVDRNLP